MPSSPRALSVQAVTTVAERAGRTVRGSGTGNGESKNTSVTVNGVTIGFTEESVDGKNISIRAVDTGRVQLSIAGDRRPKQYHSDQRNPSRCLELESAATSA